MRLLACCLLACIILKCVSGNCGPWVAIDWQTLEKPAPTDSIEIIYVAAPLLECSYENDFAPLGAYHGGLAFRNQRTSFTFTLNYDAYPSFTGAIIPTIVELKNKTELQWYNTGRVFVYMGLNTTYWERVLNVGTMTGAQMTQFIQWVGTTNNDTYVYYNLWTVYTSWPGKLLLAPFECFAYVWDCFAKITSLGGHFYPGISPRMSLITLYSSTVPKLVDVNDSAEWLQIVDFYTTLEGKYQEEGPVAFFQTLWEVMVDGYFYVRADEDYYFIELHGLPPFGIHFIEVPVNMSTSLTDSLASTLNQAGSQFNYKQNQVLREPRKQEDW